MSAAFITNQYKALAIRNILVPTDFSPASEVALATAQTLALHYGATLHVVHVAPPEDYVGRPPKGVPTVYDIDRGRSRIYLRQISNANASLGIPHEETMLEGEVWKELSKLANEQSIDLIVSGTHGAHGLEKLMLGSVAEEILRKAACPVVTVGPGVNPELVRASNFHEVLFPTDFSAQSRAALRVAALFAAQPGAHLTMLHVVEETEAPEPHIRAISSEAYTQRLLEEFPPAIVRPSTRVDFGKPGEVIVKTAEALHSDLIVLGVRTGGQLASHALWTVASQVIRHATCPVLTIRSSLPQHDEHLPASRLLN